MRVSDEAVCVGGKEERSFSFVAPCSGVPLARDYPHDSYTSVSLFDSNYKAAFFTLAFFKIPAVEKSLKSLLGRAMTIGMRQMLKTAIR